VVSRACIAQSAVMTTRNISGEGNESKKTRPPQASVPKNMSEKRYDNCDVGQTCSFEMLSNKRQKSKMPALNSIAPDS